MSSPPESTPAASRTSLDRRFARLCFINILSNVTIPLVGLVDTAMLGHLPQVTALAGVALASLIFDYLYFGLGFLRMSTTGQTAQAVGRGDAEDVAACLIRGLAWAVALGTMALVAAPLVRDLSFSVLSGTEPVKAAGAEYFNGRIWGAPAALANMVLVGWFLGREQSGRVLLLTVLGNLANVAFNWVFILYLGWGAYGAGIASALAQGVSLGTALLLVTSAGAPLRGALRRLREILRHRGSAQLNLDIFLRTLCLVTAFAAFTNASAALGTLVLAANTVLLRLLSVGSYLIDGAAYATESLAGVEHGRGRRDQLARLLRMALLLSLGFAALVLVPIVVLPRPVFGLLTVHADVIELALDLRLWLVPTLGFGAVAYILDGYFLGLTAGRTLRRAMFWSTVGVFAPALGLALASGSPAGLWAAMTALMVARAVTLGWAVPRTLAELNPA